MARILNAAFDPARIRSVVWDLDGTLYSFAAFGDIFTRYAEYLAEGCPPEQREHFRAEMARVAAGASPFAIGRAVDVVAEIVVEVDEGGELLAGWRYDGTPLSREELRRAFPNGCEPTPDRVYYLGDPWWLPLAAARRAGIEREHSTRAYFRTRADQLANPAACGIVADPRTAEALRRLRTGGIGQAVVTNAIAEEAERILEIIGLADAFDHVEANAKKPEGAARAFERVAASLGVPVESLLMVGDNLYFDLLPAHRLGLQTLYIGDPPRAWRSAVHVATDDLAGALRIVEQAVGIGRR